MKRIFFILVTFFAFFYTGCQSVEKQASVSPCDGEKFLRTLVDVYKTKYLKSLKVRQKTIDNINITMSQFRVLKRVESAQGVKTYCDALFTGAVDTRKASAFVPYTIWEGKDGGLHVNILSKKTDFVPRNFN